MKMFNRQNRKNTNMGITPLMIQQGASVGTFIATTIKTKPLALIAIFTISDLGIKTILKQSGKTIKNNIGFALGVLATTLITGPFIISWSESAYYYVNDKIVDLSDNFFSFTSALGA